MKSDEAKIRNAVLLFITDAYTGRSHRRQAHSRCMTRAFSILVLARNSDIRLYHCDANTDNHGIIPAAAEG
jgi:hypothetical protein